MDYLNSKLPISKSLVLVNQKEDVKLEIEDIEQPESKRRMKERQTKTGFRCRLFACNTLTFAKYVRRIYLCCGWKGTAFFQ